MFLKFWSGRIEAYAEKIKFSTSQLSWKNQPRIDVCFTSQKQRTSKLKIERKLNSNPEWYVEEVSKREIKLAYR